MAVEPACGARTCVNAVNIGKLLMWAGFREFQARVTRQVAAACAVKPESQSEMFAADEPERQRTTLGSLRARGKNARVAVNRASSSASHRGYCQLRTDRTALELIRHLPVVYGH